MRDWIPLPSSSKGRLALSALQAFGARRYGEVMVKDLAESAGVTTGSLYHHFGSKEGLYAFVLEEAEVRVIDRMAGAAAAVGAGRRALEAAAVVGFNVAVEQGLSWLLGEPEPIPDIRQHDPVAELLAEVLGGPAGRLGGALSAATWRAALRLVANGETPTQVRESLVFLLGEASA